MGQERWADRQLYSHRQAHDLSVRLEAINRRLSEDLEVNSKDIGLELEANEKAFNDVVEKEKVLVEKTDKLQVKYAEAHRHEVLSVNQSNLQEEIQHTTKALEEALEKKKLASEATKKLEDLDRLKQKTIDGEPVEDFERDLMKLAAEGSSFKEQIEQMLDEYYAARGWDKNGNPTREVLEDLKLQSTADNLEKIGFLGRPLPEGIPAVRGEKYKPKAF